MLLLVEPARTCASMASFISLSPLTILRHDRSPYTVLLSATVSPRRAPIQGIRFGSDSMRFDTTASGSLTRPHTRLNPPTFRVTLLSIKS